jgi:predicted nucleic acid-binding protein
MIVSNASTLILLARVGLLRKFLDEYGEVAIPPEVFKEVTRGEGLDAKMLKNEVEKKRIKVKKIRSDTRTLLEEFRLDEGEAQAYVLYQETGGRVLLTDDGELIKLCRIFEVPFVNALAVVVRLFEKKLLSKKKACDYLEALFDYGRYSMKVYEYFTKEVGC